MISLVSYKEIAVVLSLLCFLVLAYLLGIPDDQNPFPGWQVRDYEQEKVTIEDTIGEVGGAAAYTGFKKKIESLDYSAQHALAHVFGKALYEKEGLTGISVCDGSFGFGCYHSFFGAAIQEKGIGVLGELDKACIEAYGLRGTGCSHGIGHGVLSYTGEEDLSEALDLCSKLSWKGPFGGCSSGVFMEYNFRTMASFSGGALQRPLMVEKRYEPCTNITERYVESCYFEQPAWWRSSLEQAGLTPSQTYMEMGSWCEGLKEEKAWKACFRGIGNVIPANSSYDVALSVERCDLMPNRAGRDICRQGAAWGFFADPAYRDQAVYLCSLGMTEDTQKECERSYIVI